MLRMAVDQEVAVRRVRVQADAGLAPVSRRGGHEPRQERADRRLVLGRDVAAHALGIRDFAVVVDGRLHAVAEVGERVEEPPSVDLPQRDGAGLGSEEAVIAQRLEPVEDLPLDGERQPPSSVGGR